VEGKLADFVNDNVRLVANRKALYLGNLGRLPSLLVFGPALDGSEFDLREQYAAWRGSYFAKTTDPVSDTWQLTGDDVGAATVTASYVPVADRLSRMVAIARRFQDHGVRVVFEVPPLAQSAQDAPERAPVMKAFMRDLERATQSEVWDWSAAIVSDVMFNGKTHLNQRGRALWSKVVALQVAKGNYFDGRGP